MESLSNISIWRYTENQRNYPGWHLNADTSELRFKSSVAT